MILSRECISFKEGVKPALLTKADFYSLPVIKRKREEGITLKAKKMPTIVQHLLDLGYPHVKLPTRGDYLFFQNEDGLQDFLANSSREVIFEGKPYLDFNPSMIGLVLGYPPIAVEYAMTINGGILNGEREKKPKVAIDYYGINFVCHPYDVEASIEWCNSTYTLPPEIKQWNSGLRVDKLPYDLWKKSTTNV